jgi:aerobic carbon-monoxide dehydrogenase medium subunit
MENFHYIKPRSLKDAIDALHQYNNAFVLAGGTDLLVKMKYRSITPECIIDIKAIPGIDTFEFKNGWRFGALTTVRDIEVSDTLKHEMPFLVQAAKALGSVQIRNRATIGGNLCNASPCANFGSTFLTLDASVKIISKDGARELSLQDFFVGPNQTALKKGELLTEIIIPENAANTEGIFLKFSVGKSNDLGLVNIAISLHRDIENNVCNKISIAMGAVAPTPIRALRAEAILNAKPLTLDLIASAAKAASDEASPILDHRASAEYRRHLVMVMVAKGIRSLFNM